MFWNQSDKMLWQESDEESILKNIKIEPTISGKTGIQITFSLRIYLKSRYLPKQNSNHSKPLEFIYYLKEI